MSQTLATRSLDGVEVPGPGTWDIDPSHSSVSFVVRHLMVSKVRGGFGSFRGEVQIADELEASTVSAEIDAASINTHDEKRDAHLRSADFLDAENHPSLGFRSTGFERTGETTFQLPGELTIRGVTRPVVLDGEFLGLTTDLSGAARAAFTASTKIDREDWGLTWNVALETGGVLVGKQITIEIDVALVRR